MNQKRVAALQFRRRNLQHQLRESESKASHPASGLPDPETAKGQQITVGELIQRCQASAQLMGISNPNKLLLMNCAYAMNQLVTRLDRLVKETEKPRIIIPGSPEAKAQ